MVNFGERGERVSGAGTLTFGGFTHVVLNTDSHFLAYLKWLTLIPQPPFCGHSGIP